MYSLRLWRDAYYTTARDQRRRPRINRGDDRPAADPNGWSKLGRCPRKTMYVQPGHYLCLGDNSPQSSDGRLWGLVPERLLLGKALDVYYPFDRFGRIR